MSILNKRGWMVATAFAVWACLGLGSAAQGQVDCDCNTGNGKGYSLDSYGTSPCGNGCGTGGSFLGRLRGAFNCDPKFRQGLWDGYCEERNQCGQGHGGLGLHGGLGRHGLFAGGAGFDSGCGEAAPVSSGDTGCDTASPSGCGTGFGWFGRHRAGGGCGLMQQVGRRQGLRFFNFPQAAGCGSGAYGLPCEADCGQAVAAPVAASVAGPADCGAAVGCGDANGCGTGGCGCASIFGIKYGCFRNDGHFFGCFSRHGHRHAAASDSGCDAGCDAAAGRCRLFSGHGQRRHGGFGLLGRGHCQNGCDTPVLAADCGNDGVSTAAPQAVPAVETTPGFVQ